MKKITLKGLFCFMGASLLLLSSCASSPKGKVTKCEPTENDSILLVGRVMATIENVPSHNGADLNGNNKKGVKVTVEETETKKTFQIAADKNGIYYVPKAKMGNHYKIVEIECYAESSSGAQWIKFPIVYNGSTVCKVKQPTILMNLNLKYDYSTRQYTWQDFGNDGSVEEIKRLFRMSYPDSEWNNCTFVYNLIR